MNGTGPGMDCNQLVELVTEYVEGRLDDAEATRFSTHLDECEGCRVYLDQMRQTIATLGHLPPETLTPEAERDLLIAFRDWRYGR